MVKATNEGLYAYVTRLLAYTGAGGEGESNNEDRGARYGPNRNRSEIGPALWIYPWRAVLVEQGADIKSNGTCKVQTPDSCSWTDAGTVAAI